jgi:hypothetical protein
MLGGVDGSLHFTVPSMNRLNQTELATFSILPCWAFFRDSYFLYFLGHNLSLLNTQWDKSENKSQPINILQIVILKLNCTIPRCFCTIPVLFARYLINTVILSFLNLVLIINIYEYQYCNRYAYRQICFTIAIVLYYVLNLKLFFSVNVVLY